MSNINKNILGQFIGLSVVALVLIGFGIQKTSYEPELGLDSSAIKAEHLLKAPKEKILESKEIDWIETKEDGTTKNKGRIISYDYVSDIEVKIDKGEDLTKRTGNAKFFQKEDNKIEGRFYLGTPFIKDGDKWFHSETATTTIEAFEEQTKLDLISRLKEYFARGALADELTPVYSGAGDGYVQSTNASWATAKSGGTLAVNYTTGDTSCGNAYLSGATYVVRRSFFPIDTSALPTGAVISAATFRYYSSYANDGGYGGQDLIQTSQSSNTTLATADFTSVTFTAGATRVVPIVNQYNIWTLNLTGRGWISDSGFTKLGIVAGRDFDDAAPTGASQDFNARYFEYTGTGSDPYLSITYTEAAEEDNVWIRQILKLE